MADVMPAKAMSAATRAKLAPMALRLTHGTSTSPATGSQMSPNIFLSTKQMAWLAWKGVPPAAIVIAAAAIAEAEPTSAWQPPSAPEIEALFAMTKPNAPAVKRKSNCCDSVKPSFSIAVVRTAGRQPADPAVGVAQTKPILALDSLTAMAFLAAPKTAESAKVFPFLI